MELIALSGYARSGKDSAAEVLVENGWTRIAFADKLRDFLYALNPIVGTETEYLDGMVDGRRWVNQWRLVRLQEVIDAYGWDGYKSTDYVSEIRPLLQRLGTEAGRQTLWDTIWIDAALKNLDPNGKYVITDCRFENEANVVIERNGMVVRINRSGVGPANAHVSETGLDSFDFDIVIENDGTLEEFKQEVARLLLCA